MSEDTGFELVSHDTRLEILRALAARLRESPAEPTIGFSALRRRVGVRDSGNFNYHLDRLTGRFVRKTDDGYRIAPAGIRVVAAVLSGVYGTGVELGPEPLPESCPVCDGGLTARFADGMVTVACEANPDHRFRMPLPPGAADDRTLSELVAVASDATRRFLRSAADGVCPLCYGRIEWDVGGDAPTESFESGCRRCGARAEVPPIVLLFGRPTAVAFFDDHGIALHDRPLWAESFHRPVSVTVADTTPQVTVTVTLDEELLTATADASLTVLDVQREPADAAPDQE